MTDNPQKYIQTEFEIYGNQYVLRFPSEKMADLYMEEEFGRDFIYDVAVPYETV